ncbi:hypothetical protein R1sor_001447 [Riccia sorocarpa]|uniref:Uncharacterized protein n=1 Tax=Riccia sorocarpa TaxID=122646 RepID=A0ABD3GZ91_9MARC
MLQEGVDENHPQFAEPPMQIPPQVVPPLMRAVHPEMRQPPPMPTLARSALTRTADTVTHGMALYTPHFQQPVQIDLNSEPQAQQDPDDTASQRQGASSVLAELGAPADGERPKKHLVATSLIVQAKRAGGLQRRNPQWMQQAFWFKFKFKGSQQPWADILDAVISSAGTRQQAIKQLFLRTKVKSPHRSLLHYMLTAWKRFLLNLRYDVSAPDILEDVTLKQLISCLAQFNPSVAKSWYSDLTQAGIRNTRTLIQAKGGGYVASYDTREFDITRLSGKLEPIIKALEALIARNQTAHSASKQDFLVQAVRFLKTLLPVTMQQKYSRPPFLLSF